MGASTSPPTEPGYLQRQWNKLSTFQLVLVFIMTVLIASGNVGWTDVSYAIASCAYFVYFATRVFPPISLRQAQGPVDQSALLFSSKKVFKLYIMGAAVLGIFLPCLYVAGTFVFDFKEGAATAGPHLFLLVAQVVSETLSADVAVSDPIKVLVPASYNTMRLVTLVKWTKATVSKEVGPMQALQVFEAVLAIANLAFWTYNLLGFLLPVYLPVQMQQYYADKAEQKRASAKRAE